MLQIESDQLQILRNMVGEYLVSVSSATCEQHSFEAGLCFNSARVRIGNEDIRAFNGSHYDEFPKFYIDFDRSAYEHRRYVDVHSAIKEVYIVCDELKWKKADLLVSLKSDVAVVWELDNGNKLAIQLVDSLADFVKVFYGTDVIHKLDDAWTQWHFKSDNLIFIHRDIRKIDSLT